MSDIRWFNTYTIYEGAEALYAIDAKHPRWSPNCRWIYGEVPYFEYTERAYTPPVDDTFRERDSEYVVIWDGNTGEIVDAFYNPFQEHTYSHTSWSPDGNYVIISTTDGSYLYHPVSGSSHFLVLPDELDAFRTRFSTYWDFQRGQVLIEGWSAVYAFDLITGEWRFSFAPDFNRVRYGFGGSRMYVIDNQYLIFRGFHFEVWNLDTHEGKFLNVGDNRLYARKLKISPSNRFVVHFFYNSLLVWDSATLSDNQRDNIPYQIPLKYGAGYTGLAFVDETTVEIQVTNGESYTLSLLQQD